MNWDISGIQNSRHCLNLLAARKAYFRKANFLYAISFLVPISLSALSFAFLGTQGEMAAWLALFALVYTLAEASWFEPTILKTTKIGAGLTEDFDCSVFDLPLNESFRTPLSSASIHCSIETFSPLQIATLRDWYRKELERLPRHIAALVAQYTSTAYDQALRKAWLIVLWSGLTILICSVVVVSYHQDLRLRESMLTFLVPFVPLAVWFVKNIVITNSLVQDQESALLLMDQQWQTIRRGRLTGVPLAMTIRDNQDALYVRRTSGALLFPGLYPLLRPRRERGAERDAEKFLAEYQGRA